MTLFTFSRGANKKTSPFVKEMRPRITMNVAWELEEADSNMSTPTMIANGLNILGSLGLNLV
jgi:hypothetical protein